MDFATNSATLKSFLLNLPSKSQEDWKYTDFSLFKKQEYGLSASGDSNTIQYLPQEKKVVVHLKSAFSKIWAVEDLPPGLTLETEALASVPKLNGFFDEIDAGMTSNKVQLVFDEAFDSSLLVEVLLHGKETMAPQYQFVNKSLQIVLKDRARVLLVEKAYFNQKQFVNLNVQYFIHQNARLDFLKIEKGQAEGRGCQTSFFSVGKNSEVCGTTAVMGGEWSRHNLHAHLSQTNANVQFLSASVLNNSEYVDHHTWIDHQVGDTQSLQR